MVSLLNILIVNTGTYAPSSVSTRFPSVDLEQLRLVALIKVASYRFVSSSLAQARTVVVVGSSTTQLRPMSDARWYSSAIRVFDGPLVCQHRFLSDDVSHPTFQLIVGEIQEPNPFFNTPSMAVNTFEFFPATDGDVTRPSPFLERSMPANLFPR